MENKSFDELGLSEEVLSGIRKKGFEEPTAIQAMTIPVMLRDDTDIIAQAQTGTGKTAAFGLPLIEMISANAKTVQAIILVPTRELAIQVAEEITSLKGKKDLRVIPIYGGQAIDQQLRKLKKGTHIVVGTPGRVIDHLKRKTLKLQAIEHLILDEADEMLNMGFVDDIDEIMAFTNQEKRTLLFSATMPAKIRELSKKYMKGYEHLKVKKQTLTTSLTEQIYFEVNARDKFEALCRIVDISEEFYGLVFCRTKSDTSEVAAHLVDRGYDAEAIHGDISQAQREKTLGRFKKKKVTILVATDVAARGIDVNDLTHVINFSLPHDSEAYVHRIGRTGRAGKQGTAITFITPSEYRRLMFIQRSTKTDIKKSKLPGVKDIIASKKKKVSDDLFAILSEEIPKEYMAWAKKLMGDQEPEKVMAALLNLCFEDEVSPNSYQEIQDVRERKGGRNSGRDGKRNGRDRGRGRQVDEHGKARLFVALGKKDKVNAKKVVDLITEKVSIRPRDIRDVQVMEKFSFITVPFDMAEDVIDSFRKKGKRPLITRAKR